MQIFDWHLLIQLVFFLIHEHWKDGLGCPKDNIGKLYSSKCLSWNNTNGWIFFVDAIVNNLKSLSIICLHPKHFVLMCLHNFLLQLLQNCLKFSIWWIFSNSSFCNWSLWFIFASFIKPCQFGLIETYIYIMEFNKFVLPLS